jgi:hypothetical protein
MGCFLIPWIFYQRISQYLFKAICFDGLWLHLMGERSLYRNTARENILKGGQMARDGFQLFHREWANIQAGLNRVSKNSVEGEKAAELFNSYMVAGAELLPLHYFPKDCRSFLETR